MDLTMSIAAASMDMSMAKLQQDVSISMLKRAMESQEASIDVMMDGINATMQPPAEHMIDTYA